MNTQTTVGDSPADTITTFRVPLKECAHDDIRYPRSIPKNPGQDVYCARCGMEYTRPRWMDRFTPHELRTLQGIGEIVAVWLDYTDPEPERRISQRIAYQRLTALLQVHHLTGREEYVAGILERLGKSL